MKVEPHDLANPMLEAPPLHTVTLRGLHFKQMNFGEHVQAIELPFLSGTVDENVMTSNN